jgi:hypothetical protein
MNFVELQIIEMKNEIYIYIYIYIYKTSTLVIIYLAIIYLIT